MPSRSPDLNLIENIFSYILRIIRKEHLRHPIKTERMLWIKTKSIFFKDPKVNIMI